MRFRKYRFKETINKTVWLIALLVLTITANALKISAQAEQSSPQRGIQAKGAYAIGDIETINTANGNLMLNIPLASLPSGRGGKSGGGVSLFYNSKLWDTRTVSYMNGTGTFLKDNPKGGWLLSYAYKLEVVDKRNEEYNPYGGPSCYTDYNNYPKFFKFKMNFPDGSTREFHPSSTNPNPAFQSYYDYYDVDLEGRKYYCQGTADPSMIYLRNTAPTYGTRNFFTTDGSNLRLEISYTQQNGIYYQSWTLYYPNGARVVKSASLNSSAVARQETYDSNGNKSVVESDEAAGTTTISDDLGRVINVTDTGVSMKGVNGEQLDWTISWKTIRPNRTYSPAGGFTAQSLPSIRVIDQITLPQQMGSRTYLFTYGANEAGTDSSGLGEIKSITLPSGAQMAYTYKNDSATTLDANKIMTNIPIRKDLTYLSEYDGTSTSQTESWIYEPGAGDKSISKIIMPDGSESSQVFTTDSNPVFNGLNISSEDNRTRVEKRMLNGNLNVGATLNYNPYVKTEYASIKDATGTPTLTAIKDYEYDLNGNVLQVKEYDWVAYSSIPRDQDGKPSGIPGGALLKRTAVNTYYNPTPNVSGNQDSSNAYWQPGAPLLKNALQSTEIKDENGNVVSRSEYTYDNASTTGNLIEAKTWDSSKGAYSNPLTSGNSVSVTNQYDTYGNLTQTTDAKGIVSKLTYGNITTPTGTVSDLYPTQSVAAFGTAEARTTQMEYDFSTGAVKKVTDADNSVSTETEYDALARPTKTKAAAGTANEIWTQTVYDDVNRRVIAKSDIETKGDARKVAIQHFDQLGRVRLTRWLEDAATQSATDESQGIKVQTRYKYDNPADPANSNGSYTLASNPYRAATSAQASGEEAMGWTISYADKTGKNATTKTYAGATLPAPFVSSGANTNLTGTVSTAIDSNITTAMDQAGKQRRSLTNGLGQLVRVDEPNDAGKFRNSCESESIDCLQL